MEEWKGVPDYEDLYKVSSHGRIMSCGHLRRTLGTTKTRINKGSSNKMGYCLVVLCRDNKITRRLLHRVVAKLFIPNPHGFPCINHKDNNPRNNRVDNLEWCTISYNTKYAYDCGRIISQNKRQVRLIKNGIVVMEFESMKACSEHFGKGECWLSKKHQHNQMQYGGYQIVCAPPLWACKLTGEKLPDWLEV